MLVQPDPASQITSRLKKGQQVHVLEEPAPGWLAIAPPAGSFSWIERSAIEDAGNDQARVTARAAAVRPGSDEASLPAGIWTIAHQGDTVRLLDRPPLVIRQPEDVRRVWYAIEPPADEVRYLRSDGVSTTPIRNVGNRSGDFTNEPEFDRAADPHGRWDTKHWRVERIDPSLATVEPLPNAARLDPEFARRMHEIEVRHRLILKSPLESWSLDSVRSDYDQLRSTAAGSAEQQAALTRVAQVERQLQLSRLARELANSIARTRALEANVAQVRAELQEIEAEKNDPFEAEGLLQTSSILVGGRPAHLLIDQSGKTEAYVVVQPGLVLDQYLARQVGIHGESRYDSTLKARVVYARRVVPLNDLR